MVDERIEPPSAEQPEDELRRTIMGKAVRRDRARRRGSTSPLAWVASFGVVGWTVVVPTVAGVLLGRVLDARVDSDISFTITLLVLGAIVGIAGAWHWISSEAGRGGSP